MSIALFVAISLFQAPAAIAVGLLAQPANFYLVAQREEVVEAQIRISSTSDAAAVRVSLSPFTIDEHGLPAACLCRTDRALVQWAELSANRVFLQPGRYETITLHLTVPQSANGSYWSAVLIDIDETFDGAAGQTLVRPRLAIPVVVTVVGTDVAHAKVTELKAFTTKTGDVVVSGVVTNDGNTVLHAPLVLALEDASTIPPTEYASIEDAIITVLPGTRRVFRLTLAREITARPELRVTAWLRFAAGAEGIAEGICGVSAQPPCDSDGCLAT